jgi:hypothetical protein
LSARMPRESARPQPPAQLPPQDPPPASQSPRPDAGVPQFRAPQFLALLARTWERGLGDESSRSESFRSTPRTSAVPGAWVAATDDQRPCSASKEANETQAMPTRKTTPRAPIVDAAGMVRQAALSQAALPQPLAQGLASAHAHSQSADNRQSEEISVMMSAQQQLQQRRRPATHHSRERRAKTSTCTPRNGTTQMRARSQEQLRPQPKPPSPQTPPTKTHDQAATLEKCVSAVHRDASHAAATAASSPSARSARDRERDRTALRAAQKAVAAAVAAAGDARMRGMSITQGQELQLAAQVWARQTQVSTK